MASVEIANITATVERALATAKNEETKLLANALILLLKDLDYMQFNLEEENFTDETWEEIT